MRDHEKRQPRIRQHHLLEEKAYVPLIVGKPPHMPRTRLLQQPFGAALPACVEGRDPETHGRQIADRFEIFLDTFVPAMQQNDGSARNVPAGAEDRISKLFAAMAGKITDGMVAGNRVVFALAQCGFDHRSFPAVMPFRDRSTASEGQRKNCRNRRLKQSRFRPVRQKKKGRYCFCPRRMSPMTEVLWLPN
ncbi:hypothetical protein AGR5A_Lc70052 [Agrobacterium genomosp. 5 str. CFBP 6626]|nr:hypothetical protein AGR5A_Lc70052 [Agrobacterium genomosp. 5 str. CFBP 6626]